jgi:hypothetical protein
MILDMDSQTIKRSHPGKSEGSMPAAVNKTAGITNPANQLMITMTAISPLLMLQVPLSAYIIFSRQGKIISRAVGIEKVVNKQASKQTG